MTRSVIIAANPFFETGRQLLDSTAVTDIPQHRDKFIAADTRHQGIRSQLVRQIGPDSSDDYIAAGMTKIVIDRFQIVNIHKKNSSAGGIGVSRCQFFVQVFH